MKTESLIEFFLEPVRPSSVLALGPAPWQALRQYCEQREIVYQFWDIRQSVASSSRFDLSVAYDFEKLEKKDVRNQLGMLKNLVSARVWALTPESSDWTLKDFVELGFTRDSLPSQIAAQSYSYNLATYNHHRDWNSPQYWANPNRWHVRF